MVSKHRHPHQPVFRVPKLIHYQSINQIKTFNVVRITRVTA